MLSERFTIGPVLALSWRAFLVDPWRYLAIAIVVAAASLDQSQLSGDSDPHGALGAFLITSCISAAIMSFAIAPITLGILEPDSGRSGLLDHVRAWKRTLRVIVASCILQVIAY